jgi:hypothetical protein
MGRTFLATSAAFLIPFLLTASVFGAQISGAPVKIAGWDVYDPGNQADGRPATLTYLAGPMACAMGYFLAPLRG